MSRRILDNTTADIGFEAQGSDLKTLFLESGLALSSLICHITEVKPIEEREIKVTGEHVEELMLNWLQSIIALVDTEEMFFSSFEIVSIDDKSLRALVKGEPIRPELGDIVVKAITYHDFKLEKIESGYKVKVNVDV